jgi:hypothetical protein
MYCVLLYTIRREERRERERANEERREGERQRSSLLLYTCTPLVTTDLFYFPGL